MDALAELLRRYPTGTARPVWHPPRAVIPGVTVIFAGVECQATQEYAFSGIGRRDGATAAFQYTFAGEGRLQYEGVEHRVRPGQAMLLYFPHDHRYWLPGGTWSYFFIAFAGDLVRSLFQELVSVAGPLVEISPEGPALRAAVGVCERVFAGDIHSPYEASEVAYSVAMRLVETLVPSQTRLPVRAWQNPEFVTRVEAFCMKNLAKPIGVDDMARIAKMSRYHFSRRFEAIVGVPPGRYLANLRLDEARRLLLASERPVHEVAARCGFSDPRYFAKVFRSKYGLLPSRVRAS